jgi:AAA+ superfamily predicted ATPase
MGSISDPACGSMDEICVFGLAHDVGTGRAHVADSNSEGGWVFIETTVGFDCLCIKCQTALSWSGSSHVALDALVWRRSHRTTPLCAPRLCVDSGTLRARCVTPIDVSRVCVARTLRAQGSRRVALWQRKGAELFWATQMFKCVMREGVLVSAGWWVDGGPSMGHVLITHASGDSEDAQYFTVDAITVVSVSGDGFDALAVPRNVIPVGGVQDILASVAEHAFVERKRVLLRGLSGCGKTSIITWFCHEKDLPMVIVECSQRGVDEQSIRGAIADAELEAEYHHGVSHPYGAAILLDQLETLPSTMVSVLLSALDCCSARVCVFGTVTEADELPSSLRRLFGTEITVGAPASQSRQQIALVLSEHMCIPPPPDDIGERTVGMTGADIRALCCSAREVGWEIALESGPRMSLIGHGINIDVAKTKWEDVGGLDAVKQKLRRAVEWPLMHAQVMAALRIPNARGVLLHGPPGGGKTTLVRALATNVHASFFVLSAASVYSPWVGAAEKVVRDVFERARSFPPSIIFIDEIEAVVGKRGSLESGEDASHRVQERVLSTLLNEMDGVEQSKAVVVVVSCLVGSFVKFCCYMFV